MPEQRVDNVQVARHILRQELLNIQDVLTRSGSSADEMLKEVGLTLLGLIRKAFVTKARGGVDEAGDKWPPLAPSTIAYKRKAGRTRLQKKRPSFPSQALTLKQQEQWWEYYRRGLNKYKGNKGRAAAVAWIIMKELGATTLIQRYGHWPVLILRDKQILINSLTPGSNTPEQVFRVGRGEVTVGTTREGAVNHHKGRPPRFPQRRLWPAPARWPATWWRAILKTIRTGVADLVVRMVRSNP